MLNEHKIMSDEKKVSVFRFVILFCLWLWAFWSDIVGIARFSTVSSEMAHVLVLPVAMILLIYHRRSELLNNITGGSSWGIVIMIAGIIIFIGSTWPFSYGYTRQMALVPIIASVILAGFGWKVLKISVPMLILLMLSIPVGMRLYASLVIIPETYTITAVSKILGLVPGLNIQLSGIDILFSSDSNAGIIALGESNRGVRLLLVYAFIGVFVAFSENRSFWRLFTVAIIAGPVIFFCNFIRLFTWGIITIYTAISPTSTLMRNVSAVVSLILCYLFFSFVCSVGFKRHTEIGNDIYPGDCKC